MTKSPKLKQPKLGSCSSFAVGVSSFEEPSAVAIGSNAPVVASAFESLVAKQMVRFGCSLLARYSRAMVAAAVVDATEHAFAVVPD